MSAVSPVAPVSSSYDFLRVVSGRIIHRDPQATPIHHMTVRIGKDVRFQKDPFVTTSTSIDGKFSLALTPELNEGTLYLEVVDKPWELKGEERVVYRVNIEPGKVDLGDISVDFWEYQPGRPMLKMPENRGLLQTSTTSYTLAVIQGAAPIKGVGLALKVSGFPLSPEMTQQLYPENLTLKSEKYQPGITKTGHWMADRLLKGFNPCHLLKGRNQGEYVIWINWDRYEFDREYHLPNAIATLKGKGTDFRVSKVALQWRKTVSSGSTNPSVYRKHKLQLYRLTEWMEYPEDSPEFTRALTFFRTAYLALGEIDEHLGAGHLNVEQYAVAAFRNLRENPLKKLLFPHLRDVVLINDQGSEVIFGPKGALTTTTALTDKGVDARFRRKLGHMDYTDWSPRKPISDQHQFARVENLYWNLVKDWVEIFFKENEEGIVQQWPEILKMSQDLVNHSVPYHSLGKINRSDWADISEIDASRAPRKKVEGKYKAIRPITESETPQEGELAKLKQAAAYMIFFSTFWHSWVHNLQQEDAGDINYATLGLKKGGELPDPSEVVTQLELANLLPSVKYGYITKNENGDIDPRFIALLNQHREAFLDLGINPDTFIRCCINI